LGSAQQNHHAAEPLAHLGSDSLSLLATESLVGAGAALSLSRAFSTIAASVPSPAQTISWLGRILHYSSTAAVGPPSAVQSTPAVFATQWFSNQAIASAQLPSADFLRSFRLPAIQCSAVPEHCCQPIAHFSTLPVSYSPLSAQPLRPALRTADQSNSRQLPKQPIDCAQKPAHLVQAGECDQWYNGTLVFTSDQPAVTPWLSGGGLPSAHPDHVSQIAPTIPSAAPMGAGASAPSLSLSLPTSIPWSVGSTRGPSHPYRVGRGRRPGGPSTVGPGDVSLPIPTTQPPFPSKPFRSCSRILDGFRFRFHRWFHTGLHAYGLF
jgi:hypothetical protein